MRLGHGLSLSLAVVVACGSEGAASGPSLPASAMPDAGAATTSSTTPNADAGAPTDLPSDPIVGLWSVSGTDARGAYEGQVEVRPEGASYRFIRAVRYPNVLVEDGRELHWLFRGTLAKNGSTVSLEGSLKRMDFISKRGTLERTAKDGPVTITGQLALGATEVTGTISCAPASIALIDTWSARKPLPQKPIFVDERVTTPAHAPPSALEKQTNFNLYASFHTSTS